MNLRFHIDPETGYPHIYDHGVEEYEVEDVIMESGEDMPGRGNSRIAIGQTWGGRYLLVVYVRDSEPLDSVFIITAYDLTGRTLAAYRRRIRRRNR